MAFSLTSISPDTVLSDGGREIIITGVFEEGHSYKVFMGDLGTVGDPGCCSGIPGQGYLIYPSPPVLGGAFTRLVVYSPKVNPSVTPYTITVIDYNTLEAHTLSAVITACKNQYFTTVYSMKRLFPPHYKTGSRSIELEDPT